MDSTKTRITKLPQERKNEIIETAMRVFTQKGYETTTMRDIAKEMNVVPGLCYRYFESKQELYQTAIKEYAQDYCAPIIKILDNVEPDFAKIHASLSKHFSATTDREKYHTFFHKPENKSFDIMLNNTVCNILTPHMANLLERLQKAGESDIENADFYARFILFGLSAVMDDSTKPIEQRMQTAAVMIKRFIRKR